MEKRSSGILMRKLWIAGLFISFSLQAERIKVPIYLDGVKPDQQNLKNEFYVYDVEGQLKSSDIKPSLVLNPTNVPQLASTLLYAYQQGDEKLFKNLFDKETLTIINQIPAAEFSKRLSDFKNLGDCVLVFYFANKNGFVFRWKEKKESGKMDIMFAKSVDGFMKLKQFNATADDLRFLNISYYLTYPEFKFQKAKIIKNIDPKKNDYLLEIEAKYPFIIFLKKQDGRWYKRTYLKDNVKDKYQFSDIDPRIGRLKIPFAAENFAAGEDHEILIVESTYPITFLPFNFAEDGQIKVKTP